MPQWNNTPFTCANGRYHTATTKGGPHDPLSQTGGNVLAGPICINNDGYSLWLEYVDDRHGPGGWQTEPLWLMWYDPNGYPTVNQSATFDLSHVRTMLAGLIR